jgi:hypothetical protein
MATYSDLPPEILEAIASYLLPAEIEPNPIPSASENACWINSRLFITRLKRRDILALSLVSKIWNRVAGRVLYRDVELFRNWNEKDRLKPFLRSAVTGGRVEHVRSLAFDITVVNGDSHAEDRGSGDEYLTSPVVRKAITDGRMLLRREGTGVEDDTWVPSPWSLASSRFTSSNILIAAYLLSILNLTQVKILLDQTPPLWGSLLQQPAFKSLTSLTLIWTSFSSTDQKWEHPQVLLPIFSLPALRDLSLRFWRIALISNNPFLQHPTPSPLAGSSQITSMTFSLGHYLVDVACYLLSHPRALTSFTYIFSTSVQARFESNFHSYRAYGLQTTQDRLPGYLDVALSSQKHSLQRLIVKPRGDIRKENCGAPIMSLRDFTVLEEIEMPLPLLLSYKSFSPKQNVFRPDELVLGELGERLPRGLKTLKIWLWEDWCVELAVEELKVLMEMKEELVPNLGSVIMEFWMRSQGIYDPILEEKARELMVLENIGEMVGVHVKMIIDEGNQSKRWNLN